MARAVKGENEVQLHEVQFEVLEKVPGVCGGLKWVKKNQGMGKKHWAPLKE